MRETDLGVVPRCCLLTSWNRSDNRAHASPLLGVDDWKPVQVSEETGPSALYPPLSVKLIDGQLTVVLTDD